MAATRPVRRTGVVHDVLTSALRSTRSPMARYGGIAAARLSDVARDLNASRAVRARGISSRRVVSRSARSNSKLRVGSEDDCVLRAAFCVGDVSVDNPLPVTSSERVLAPIA